MRKKYVQKEAKSIYVQKADSRGGSGRHADGSLYSVQAFAGRFTDAFDHGGGYAEADAYSNAFAVTHSFRHNLTGNLCCGFPGGIRFRGSQRIPFGYLISSTGKGGKLAAFS